MSDLHHAATSPAAEPAAPPNFDRRGLVLSLALTAVFDVGVALAAFSFARHWGASDTVAYLAAGIGPLIMILITWIRARTLSGASVVILLYVLLSSVAALIGGTDPRLLLAKDSLVTGGFGLACLLSVVFGKPLMFYFGAKFATDGTEAGARMWSGLWRYPDFRSSQYRINTAWGVGFLVEAALRIAVAYGVPSFSLANAIVTILPLLFLAGLLAYTFSVGRRTRAAAMARRATAVTPQPTA